MCFVGAATNLLSCITFTRPHMRKNFNILLTVLSVSDGVGLILGGVAFTLIYVTRYSHFVGCSNVVLWTIKLGWGWGFILCKNMNLWLTVSVALVRYRSISRVAYSYFSKKHIALVCVVSFMLSTNIYLPWAFVPNKMSPEDDCVALLNPNDGIMSETLERVFLAINLFVPGICLLVASVLIISVVFKAQTRRETMSHGSSQRQSRTQTSRATTMILMMMSFSAVNQLNYLLAYITIYTQGLGLGLAVSQQLLDILYEIALFIQILNCSVNFFIYLILPSFRKTLIELFHFKK